MSAAARRAESGPPPFTRRASWRRTRTHAAGRGEGAGQRRAVGRMHRAADAATRPSAARQAASLHPASDAPRVSRGSLVAPRRSRPRPGGSREPGGRQQGQRDSGPPPQDRQDRAAGFQAAARPRRAQRFATRRLPFPSPPVFCRRSENGRDLSVALGGGGRRQTRTPHATECALRVEGVHVLGAGFTRPRARRARAAAG